MKKNLKQVKILTTKNNFNFTILSLLKQGKNPAKISKDLSISMPNLAYYLRRMKKDGLIVKRGYGVWEVLKEVKILTKYGSDLPKDYVRGHAYVWRLYFPKEIKGYDQRIKRLRELDMHFKLIGITKNIPRIKVLGRKIWLCKDHIRIFEKKSASFYGDNAVESKKQAFREVLEIVRVLENKLGVSLKPLNIETAREHYALIKNDLAIDQNKQGIIWRISDKDGEWLLIDDSLGQGGELENIGKGSLKTNIEMKKWWNEQKETKFEVTPKFILNGFNQLTQNLNYHAENMKSHIKAVQDLGKGVEELVKVVKELKEKSI
jgi:hypothetical protein